MTDPQNPFPLFPSTPETNASEYTPDNARHTSAAIPWRRLAWPTTMSVLGLLGIAALLAALFAATYAPENDESQASAAGHASSSATLATDTEATTTAPTSAAPSASGTANVTANGGEQENIPIAKLADKEWVTKIAKSSGIPERALQAYAGASIAVSRTHPSCGLGWNTLAAIGQVETEHGSTNNATLHADGTVAPSIIGVALDGNGNNRTPDTDRGEIDGDTTWDRAVGPMQFIPATWKSAAQDGNRDGKQDINQIDDAALAAGLYLCKTGGNLTQSKNWISAISAYNPSVDYNHRVAEAAQHYATINVD
ncbi:lytic transglycosylase domain-containing protein [Bifidobacterium aquikefiricola]|uniref:Lytic transglycosylase domain-containing protein n=1 Tax=Bifidobacterium aquikefiricola TaxID=3059038 RepID=A0AB39U6F0_9BIFI